MFPWVGDQDDRPAANRPASPSGNADHPARLGAGREPVGCPAADQGHAYAQTNLGVLYREGRGVTQDNAEALKLYTLAATQDDAEALEVGIEEASKLAKRIRESAQGLYLMPPFGNASIAERVMESVR